MYFSHIQREIFNPNLPSSDQTETEIGRKFINYVITKCLFHTHVYIYKYEELKTDIFFLFTLLWMFLVICRASYILGRASKF